MESITRVFSQFDMYEMYRRREKLDAPPSLYFGFTSAAFVYDSSFFGATSPILGQRYRFEVSPFMGTLNYYNVLTDYRRYFMPLRPFTIAFRLLHYGRYGRDGGSDRLYPLFLGYGSLVRGYNMRSYDTGEVEVGQNPFNFDQLVGSKMIVANAELRFPLFNVLGLGRGYYGIFPLEFLAFFDAGVAWTNEQKAWFLGGGRKLVRSAGIGLRANLMGFFVLGVDYVRPFDRPNKGWYVQLTLMPGF
jgi:outer membrane protein assembly factor BamA